MMRASAVILLTWGGFTACKTASTSQVKHEWGKTVKPGQELNCQEEPAGPYQAYIRQQLERLASRNPQVFTGPLEARKFCIMPIEADEIDAGASWDGSLFINTGVLKAAQNDAQFAAAIAHELAHITMRHGVMEMAEFAAERPQYQAEFQALEASLLAARNAVAAVEPQGSVPYQEFLRSLIQKEWNRAKFTQKTAIECTNTARLFIKPAELELRANQQNPQLATFEDSLCRALDRQFQIEHQEQSLFSNWKETDADEVGYEFFLKAGYAVDEYASFFENVAAIGGADANCERGEKDHPGDCWRAKNIREELKKHGRELGYAAGSAKDVFGTSLLDLKAQYK